MKVYLVLASSGYDGYYGDVETPVKIFSSQENAEKYVKDKNNFRVEKYELE